MSRRHKGHAPEPDTSHDDETGTIPCARGNRCEERDYLGTPKQGPRNLCVTDTRYLRQDIGELPQRYVELRLILGRIGQGGDERVSGSREAPIPLAADVEALMCEIVHIACSWETAVRTQARLTPHPAGPDHRRRDGVRLAVACETMAGRWDGREYIGGNFDVLLSLGPQLMKRAIPQSRVEEIINADKEGTERGRFVIDRSGQAWERVSLNGTQAAAEFFALTGKVRGALGLTLPRRRITEVRCDGCNGKATLVQPGARSGGWEDKVVCTNCPNVYTGSRFTLLMSRIYQIDIAAQAAQAGNPETTTRVV